MVSTVVRLLYQRNKTHSWLNYLKSTAFALPPDRGEKIACQNSFRFFSFLAFRKHQGHPSKDSFSLHQDAIELSVIPPFH